MRNEQERTHDIEVRSDVEDRKLRHHRPFNGRAGRIHEEMKHFLDEMRKCKSAEERRKLMDEHSRRMRQIKESREVEAN